MRMTLGQTQISQEYFWPEKQNEYKIIVLPPHFESE